MAACRFDVPQRTRTLIFDFILTQCTHRSGGHPDSEETRRDRRPGGDDCPGGDPGILTDLGTIENDRSNPDQRTIPNATAMDDGAMPDGDLVAEDRRKATCRNVQRHLILDIRAFADADPLDITAQYGSIKNTRIGADLDVSDDNRAGRDPDAVMKTRPSGSKAADDRAGPKIRHTTRALGSGIKAVAAVIT